MFIEAKDDGGGGGNWIRAISRAKLQSNHHHQQTNIQFLLQAGCPSCRPTNSVKALKGKISHSKDLLTPNLSGGLLWPLIAPGYLGGGFPCLSSALWCQYPSILIATHFHYEIHKYNGLHTSAELNTSGRRKLSSAHNSWRLFCSGVPVSSRRLADLNSLTISDSCMHHQQSTSQPAGYHLNKRERHSVECIPSPRPLTPHNCY